MLGVHHLASEGVGYYLSDVADEVPWPHLPRPAWVGRGAGELGLGGDVTSLHLETVLGGRDPRTGHALRSPRAAVPGFDLTFSAPKSVSVLFGLGGAGVGGHVLDAHRGGVEGALTYIERHALGAQRGSGEDRRIVPTNGLVGVAFTHAVSRTLDPHLHTHVVVANVVHGVDGQWGACDRRGVWAHRLAAAAVYDAHVRDALSISLGVEWRARHGAAAEVRGISPLLVGEFSSRAADIRRQLAMWGSRSSRGAHAAWAATRPAKGPDVTGAALLEDWARRAHAVGGAGIDAVLARSGQGGERLVVDEHRFHAALARAPDGAARRRDVVAAFGVAAVSGVSAGTLERLTDLWVAPPSPEQVGVAERAHPLRAVVPAPHLLHELGPRPLHPGAHECWRDAARCLDQYRDRWGTTICADTIEPACRSTDHLIERLQTERTVREARVRLGWQPATERELGRGR